MTESAPVGLIIKGDLPLGRDEQRQAVSHYNLVMRLVHRPIFLRNSAGSGPHRADWTRFHASGAIVGQTTGGRISPRCIERAF